MNHLKAQPRFDMKARPTVVIGAGTLGSRIALMLASSGGEVRLHDINPAQLDVAARYIKRELPKFVHAYNGAAGRVLYAKTLESAIDNAWLVVEAAPERLELKKTIFADVDRLAEQDAILVSSSSSIPSSQLIDRVENPSRVASLHFYMPPEQRAVEVMSCGKTSDGVIAALMDRMPLYGLIPFHVRRESLGFIFNRIWAAIKRESLEVVEEGVSTPTEVDHIFEVLLGTHGGPFRVMDKIGLDVVLDTEEHHAAVRPEISDGPRKLLKQYISEGRLGTKSGKGFYTDYPPSSLPRCP